MAGGAQQRVTEEARQAEIARYDEAYRDPTYNMKRWRQELLREWLGARRGTYLDVGCGRAESLAIADELGYAVSCGMEVVESLCDGKRVVHVLGAHSLPSQDGVWDILTCLDVLEHVIADDVPAVLAEFARVCGGEMLLGISRKPGPLHITIRDEAWWLDQVRANIPGQAAVVFADRIPEWKQPYTWVEVHR